MTPHELLVTELLTQGLANKIIAYRLGMSVGAVKFHINNVFRKLNVHNRTEAAMKARQMRRPQCLNLNP